MVKVRVIYMGYDGNIVRRAQSLAKKCRTQAPFESAEHLAAEILTVGSLKQLKGFIFFLNEKNAADEPERV